MISKSYTPQWHESPFGHIKYTLVRNQKQMNKAFGKKNAPEFMPVECLALCTVRGDKAVIQIGKTKKFSKVQVYALLVHEATHVWQEILSQMSESAPSTEFEAYSMQTISQHLFTMYEESESD